MKRFFLLSILFVVAVMSYAANNKKMNYYPTHDPVQGWSLKDHYRKQQDTYGTATGISRYTNQPSYACPVREQKQSHRSEQYDQLYRGPNYRGPYYPTPFYQQPNGAAGTPPMWSNSALNTGSNVREF